MKKSTKLLSVILAIVMLFSSMTVLASAAKAEYKTVENLEARGAYDKYGAVTRLSTEERVSILFDYLDQVLAQANIPVQTIDTKVLGVININLTSVTNALMSVDSIVNVAGKLAGNKPNGSSLLNRLTVNTWQSGMTRDKTDQLKIVAELAELIAANGGTVQQLLNDGSIDLGTILNGIVGMFADLSSVNKYLENVPALLKGFIYPLFERKDDNTDQINYLSNTNNTVDDVLTSFVQGLFTKPQSTTSYREDAFGNCISNHTLPNNPGAEGNRYFYEKSEDGKYFTCYYWDTESQGYVAETDVFVKTEEPAGSGEYVFKNSAGDNLKYYEDGSYWLPSLQASGNAANIMDISKQSGVQMFYDMIPYVFGEMAPVVLNGSVKKAIAEWFGASFTYVGEVGSEEVAALPDSDNTFFTQKQGDYLWEWSDYAVINGNHYYRFEDQIYSADLTNANANMELINWDYKIPADLLNKYIPKGTNGEALSDAGFNTILQGLNNFVGEVAGMVLAPDVVEAIDWKTGDNSLLLDNIKNAARYIIKLAPETIFGADYATDEYYNLLIDESSDNQTILCGIAAKLLEFLMPQLVLPSAESLKGQSLGAVLAMVIRELATQFLPTYNYDALIFEDYNTKTLLKGKDNSYWLDVCLTMGVDIGMSYLKNLADLGEDTEVGYKFEPSKTYAKDADVTAWEDTVDWIIDWALCDDYEWTWKMEKLVDCGDTVDLATPQDPWVKLGNIFKSILPIDQVLNVDTSQANWLETTLRTNFVEALLNLDLGAIAGDKDTEGVLRIPNDSILRSTALLPSVVTVVRDLLNNLLYKVAGGNVVDPGMVNNQVEQLFRSSTSATQDNLANLARSLLEHIGAAAQNGLLDVAMPILGYFVGWVTDAQKFADPTLSVSTGDYDYIYANGATATTTLNVTNNSAGMLLRHRNSETTDQNYVLVIDEISGDFTSSASFPIEVQPYTSASVELTMPYTEQKGVEVVVYYHYKLKDGSEIPAKELQATTYQMVSNLTPQGNTSWNDGYQSGTAGYIIRLEGSTTTANPLVTDPGSLSTTIANLSVVWNSTKDQGGTFTGSSYTGFDSTYIDSSGRAEALLNTSMQVNQPVTVNPALLKSSVDVETIPSGTVIDLGQVYANLHGKGFFGVNLDSSLTADLGNLYYCDLSEVSALFNAERDTARKAENYTEDSWAPYAQAMKDTAAFLFAPVQTSTFSATYSDERIAAALQNLETAIEGLKEQSASSTPESVLQPVLDSCEPEGQEINYQNYDLYEYWDYEEQRTAAYNLIAGTTKPEAPDAYIEGNDLSEAEINAILAAEDNSPLKTAIQKTMLQPSEEDKAAYAELFANWKPTSYSETELLDLASKLPYYKQFLVAKTTEKQFLAKEIEAANAQGYVEDNYSTDSWAAYEAALANANKVNSDPKALQSTVFDAKYQLMVARNNLMAKADSAKDQGAYMQLESLIAQADVMFQNATLYTVKEGDAAEAWANLVAALGYEYEDENRDMQNLYANSAKAYVASDRVMSSTTDAEIASQVATLQDAINQFTCSITLVPDEDVPGNDTNVEQSELVINGLVPATVNSEEGLLALVKASAPEGYTATLETVASAAGYYGTGATVKVNVAELNGQTVATYTVVIYGDVNGDGAVDAFDAAVLDLDLADKTALTGAYNLAADTNDDANVAAADYALIKDVLAGTGTINQVR